MDPMRVEPAGLRRSGSRLGRRRHDLLRLFARRTVIALPMLIALSAGVFLLAARSPFNPLAAYLEGRYQRATAAQKEAMSAQLGFDDSWWRSWWTWLGDIAGGDLGWSRVYSQPVTQVFAERVGWTVLLSACALLVAVIVALAFGLAAGRRPGSVLDRLCSGLAVIVQAVPPFVVALGAVAIFAVGLQIAPAGGVSEPGQPATAAATATHLVLPVLALALTQVPWLLLAVRTSVTRAMASDAVRGARARGLSPTVVLGKHVLPVSLAPLVTLLGARLPELIVGTVLVEEIFAWPGLAAAVVASAKALDFPLLAALTLATTAAVLLGSLLSDAAYLVLDPRVDPIV